MTHTNSVTLTVDPATVASLITAILSPGFTAKKLTELLGTIRLVVMLAVGAVPKET
jgi:hypothetical protein